jgi:putative transposase
MGRIKGYDGVRKIKGRKRHIIVDNQGFLLAAIVSQADENDRYGLNELFNNLTAKGLALKKIIANMGYNGLPTRNMVAQWCFDGCFK